MSFTVDSIERDEKTNDLKVIAYDLLYQASAHTFQEVIDQIGNNYSIKSVVVAIADILGFAGTVGVGGASIEFPEGANYDGTETLREILDDAAEATGSIYFTTYDGKLGFRHLKTSAPLFTIDKNNYFELSQKGTVVLQTICATNDLGDSVSASVEGGTGTATQFIRNNGFLSLNDDITAILQVLIEKQVGGLGLAQVDCKWRGNFYTQPGDCLAFVGKDGISYLTCLLDDAITYNGGLSQKTSWNYESNQDENADNPISLGDIIKQTFAKVDKANQRIDLVASNVESNSKQISEIQINTNEIAAQVQQVKQESANAYDSLSGDINTLTQQVQAKMSAEDVEISITKALENGVSRVETTTGFTFDEKGLTVAKSDSEMETLISEDGMTVFKNGQAMLTANNQGVDAVNLHASTYLIIGSNSRLEDYQGNRTGCFYIGG